MDVVMKSAQLTYISTARCCASSRARLAAEELKDEAEQKKASESAPALETVRLKLNYASAAA